MTVIVTYFLVSDWSNVNALIIKFTLSDEIKFNHHVDTKHTDTSNSISAGDLLIIMHLGFKDPEYKSILKIEV